VGHTADITSLRWREDQDYLLVECRDGSVFVWEISSGNLEEVLFNEDAEDVLQSCPNLLDPSFGKFSSDSPLLQESLGQTLTVNVMTLNVSHILGKLCKFIDDVDFELNGTEKNLEKKSREKEAKKKIEDNSKSDDDDSNNNNNANDNNNIVRVELAQTLRHMRPRAYTKVPIHDEKKKSFNQIMYLSEPESYPLFGIGGELGSVSLLFEDRKRTEGEVCAQFRSGQYFSSLHMISTMVTIVALTILILIVTILIILTIIAIITLVTILTILIILIILTIPTILTIITLRTILIILTILTIITLLTILINTNNTNTILTTLITIQILTIVTGVYACHSQK